MAPEAPRPDDTYSRPVRILLVMTCLLALFLAGGLVPTLTGGVGDSPAGSLIPGDPVGGGASQGDPGGELGGGSAGSGFGALDPGSATQVGGDAGIDGPNPYRSQSNAVHFTVTSPQPAYWRTGAYDRYTGTGWEQTGTSEPLGGGIDGDGLDGTRLEYEVTLNRTATSLPTVWRPNSIVGRPDLSVTDQRAVRTQEPLEPGETYVGVSTRPPRDPSVLEPASADYPRSVTERYATLPEDVPDRVESFTDDLTSEDGTPYQTATTIEAWLESNKTYSLNASRTSQNMADTFIFGMDRGYCEYFATSMVVMLRSQEIPSRYVVGYSTGQSSGNAYTVRAMNAHAWVEVYFEDVGWVKFDPTPGDARLEQERESIRERDPGADYSPAERGSPGETFTADEDTPTGTETPTPSPTADDVEDAPNDDRRSESGYDISLNRTAVPGVAVEVSVSRNGEPATGVTVSFNGDTVGETDQRGTVVADVPYADEIRVDVTERAVDSLDPPGTVPSGDGRFYSVAPPTLPREVTVPVETNATVAVSGDPVPGESVTVTATVDDVPVSGAGVSVSGERVGTTDDDGRATVTLPDRTGNVTLAVERDPVAGETSVRLPEVTVDVSSSLPLALPLADATVEVRADGDPVRSAVVTLDGQRVDATGVNGTATVQLPLKSSATVGVAALGQSRTTTLSGLFANLAVALAGLALAVAGPLVAAARRGYGPRAVAGALARLPRRVLQSAQWLLVALATRGDRALGRVTARIRETVGYAVALARGTLGPGAVLSAFRDWMDGHSAELKRRVGNDGVDDGGASAARHTVRSAWAEFLGHVSLSSHRTKTPGEIARHAIDRDGLPEKPVRVLRDTFREVEYGTRSAADRLDRVEEALQAIERNREDGDSDDTNSLGGQD